jgi:putative glycosyltransferase
MELSIVTTLYYSAPYLEEFYARIREEAEKITTDYEMILVNDGSPDTSLEVGVSLFERDDRVRVIDLSRNFGHHQAIMTGLTYARGRLVFLIDCDLEIKPEILTEFYNTFQSSQADVVYGVQETRQDSWFSRVGSQMYYAIFNWLSAVPLPVNLTTARLMSRRYVAALVAHQEREIMIAGLWVITGFKQLPLLVTKSAKGSSSYDFRRKIALIVRAITSFSNKPLVLIFYLGCLIVFLSGIAATYLIFKAIFSGLLPGWPSLIVSIWLLGGLTIFCIGIIGIYLSKIFIETKQRPYAIIRRLYERSVQRDDELRALTDRRGTVLQAESQDPWSDSPRR